MKKSSAIIHCVVTSLFLSASILLAQSPGGRRATPSPLLIAMDSDHDGKLSAAEITAAPQTLLKADLNGDGAITQDELQPPPETAVASPDELSQQLMAFDKNHDGALSREELPERLQPLFDRADTDHDGKVTPAELRALAGRQSLPAGSQKMQSRDPIFLSLDLNRDGILSADELALASTSLLSLDKNHDGEVGADEMRTPQPTPLAQAAHVLEENDMDKDGKLSKAEAPDWLGGKFDALDTDHDGFLTRDELAASFASGSGGRGGAGGPGGQNSPGAGDHQKPDGDAPPQNH